MPYSIKAVPSVSFSHQQAMMVAAMGQFRLVGHSTLEVMAMYGDVAIVNKSYFGEGTHFLILADKEVYAKAMDFIEFTDYQDEVYAGA